MTTYQDPPPQSRRSARQSERGEQQAETPPYNQFTGEQPFAAQQLPAAAPVQQDVAPATGRRARPAEPEQLAPEPLNYSTQGRDPASYETQLPAAGYAPAPHDPTAFRVRDFSPEGGRRAAAPPLIEPQQPAFPAGAADLDYRTQAGPAAPAAESTPHQTLSRRELRQRQAEADAASGVAPQAPPVEQPENPSLMTQPPAELHLAPPPRLAPTPSDTPTLQAAPPPVAQASTVTSPPPPAAAPRRAVRP